MIRIITTSKPFFIFLSSRPKVIVNACAGRLSGIFPCLKKTLPLFFTACFCTNALADAASESGYDEPSSPWYLGARAGYTYKHNACVDIAIKCDRDDVGYGVFAGYKMGKHFGLELSASDLGDTNAIYPNVSLDGEISTVDLSVTYTRNLYKKIHAFGKLGVAYWDGKITGWDSVLEDSGERPILGAGIQFPLSTHVDGRFEYQYLDQLGNYWMGYTDAHFLSFSLVWNFASTKTIATNSSSTSESFALQKSSSKKTLTTGSNSGTTLAKVSKTTVQQHVESTLSDFIARP